MIIYICLQNKCLETYNVWCIIPADPDITKLTLIRLSVTNLKTPVASCSCRIESTTTTTTVSILFWSTMWPNLYGQMILLNKSTVSSSYALPLLFLLGIMVKSLLHRYWSNGNRHFFTTAQFARNTRAHTNARTYKLYC